MTIDDVLEEVKDKGCCELSSGVWVSSSEQMISEQKDWPETDESKSLNFATSDYWISTDNGIIEAVTIAEIKSRFSGE